MENTEKFIKFNERKKNSERNIIIAIILGAIASIILLISYTQEQMSFYILVGAFGLAALIFLIIGFSEFHKIKVEFKNTVLNDMFKSLIPDVEYQPRKGLSPFEVYNTEFLKKADRFHSEDYIAGKIDDVDFVSSDVRLEERHVEHTKNGTRTYYVPYFVGRVFRFKFNKDFVGSLQVLEGGSPYSRRKFNKVKLESIDFNKKFKIYSEEDLTAFYILTPDIMEAIFHLEKRNPGRIKMSFLGDYLYVGINNNKNTFELKMFRKIDKSMIEEFKKDLLVIKDFIVSLKLNNKLFKKD
jgi:hypothetical protein